jgi:branched-chain amino acid transport system permease protein
MISEIVIHGAVRGGILALLAIGFSLIFGVARIINLAQTALYMLAAYFMFTFASLYGLNLFLSALLSIVLTVFIGMCTYRLCIHPVREHTLSVLIITVAVALVFQESVLITFGGHFLGVPAFVTGYTELFSVRILNQHLLVLGIVCIILLSIWTLLTKTKLGIAIRATAQDTEVANLMGINVGRVYLITMAIAAALAAIAGVLVAPLFVLYPVMWVHPLIIVLVIIVLGGMGSVKGSFLAAFILGYTGTAFRFLVPMGAFLEGAVVLTIMLLVLLIRPEGLFGVVFEEER